MQSQSTLDYQLLQLSLCESLYSKPDYLLGSKPDDLIEFLFREYYVFLFSSHDLSSLYKLFQHEAYCVLSKHGITQDEAEYKLRSSRFVQFVQSLLSSVKSEPKIILTLQGNVHFIKGGVNPKIFYTALITLNDSLSVIGRSMVIHEKSDPCDPGATFGNKIAMCVIGNILLEVCNIT